MRVLLGLIAVASTVGLQLPVKAADDRSAQRCLQVIAPAEADAVPSPQNFVAAKCNAGVERTFRHDLALNFSRITRPLFAGEIVPIYPEFGKDIVRPGQKLSIVVASGPVRVERQVEAMQSARPGQRLFVQSPDGAIFSARYERASP